MEVSESEFNLARKHLENHPNIANEASVETKFRLYGLYKQASLGDCTEEVSDEADENAVRKHNAWMEQKGLSKPEARRAYLETVKELDPSFSLPLQKSARSRTYKKSAGCLAFLVGAFTWYVISFVINVSKTFAVPPKDAKFGVLVTGCASGLGLDLVRALLEEYDNIEVFAGVRKEADFALLKNFKNQERLHPLVLDVANAAHIKPALDAIAQTEIPLYALINNAGISMPRRVLMDQEPDTYVHAIQQVFDVNVLGLTRLTGASLNLMKSAAAKLGSARVVNVGSVMGIVYTPGCSGYCASKHALEALTADWRYLYEPQGISFSVLEPGFFRTNMCNKAFCKDGPSVCTKVALQSIFSSRPLPRYQCASVFGIPANIVTMIINIVPDRLVDIVLRTFEKLNGRVA